MPRSGTACFTADLTSVNGPIARGGWLGEALTDSVPFLLPRADPSSPLSLLPVLPLRETVPCICQEVLGSYRRSLSPSSSPSAATSAASRAADGAESLRPWGAEP